MAITVLRKTRNSIQRTCLEKAINIKNPGSRGGTWYLADNGEIRYGIKPSQREGAEKPESKRKTTDGRLKENKVMKKVGEKHGEKYTRTLDQMMEYLGGFREPGFSAMQKLHQLSGDIGILTGRIKTPVSLAGKIGKYANSGRTMEDVQDVAGTRLMCKNMQEVNLMVEGCRKTWEGQIESEDDYINNPKASYRSHHFTVTEGGKPVEIQVRTEAQNAWADWAHDQVYKAKSKLPKSVHEYGEAISEALWQYDNGKPLKLPEPPPEVKQLKMEFKWGGVAQ